MIRLPSMTSIQIIYAVIISLLVFFFGWMITPTLDRLRERMRERSANAPLTPDTEAAMLKQLRMQQASLKRLEKFRANPRDVLLYLFGLLAAGILTFMVTVYLYPFRFYVQIIFVLPATMSIFFVLIATVESRNLTESKINEQIEDLRRTVEEGKEKLKITE